MGFNVINRVTSSVVQVAKLPLGVASFGVGLVRGLASAAIRATSGAGSPAHAEWVAPAEPLSEDAPSEEALSEETPSDEALSEEPAEVQRVLQQDFPPAAPQRAPAEPGEAFVTEPSAVTRASAHGGGGADAEIDDWYGETFLDDAEETPGSVVEALEFGDQFAEPADVKAILSEAETLRRAAELPGERV